MNILATVTVDEKNKLLKLVEKNNSLIEVKSILEDDKLINRYNNDKKFIEKEINEWWSIILKKYNLEDVGICYTIDFENNCIYSK